MNDFKLGEKLKVVSLKRNVIASVYEPDGLHLKCRWLDNQKNMQHDIFHVNELERIIETVSVKTVSVEKRKRESIW